MDENQEQETKEYSIKEELKDEGKFFGKTLIVSAIDGAGKLGRGVINVFRKHPTVEKLEDEVETHVEELKESEAET